MKSPRLKAAEQGNTHYDGQPCRTCGNTLKYTSTGNCVVCTRAKTNDHRAKVRELLEKAKGGA